MNVRQTLLVESALQLAMSLVSYDLSERSMAA